jgi:hypothetical protein
VFPPGEFGEQDLRKKTLSERFRPVEGRGLPVRSRLLAMPEVLRTRSKRTR